MFAAGLSMLFHSLLVPRGEHVWISSNTAAESKGAKKLCSGRCCGGDDPPRQDLGLGSQAEGREMFKLHSRMERQGMSGAGTASSKSVPGPPWGPRVSAQGGLTQLV